MSGHCSRQESCTECVKQAQPTFSSRPCMLVSAAWKSVSHRKYCSSDRSVFAVSNVRRPSNPTTGGREENAERRRSKHGTGHLGG